MIAYEIILAIGDKKKTYTETTETAAFDLAKKLRKENPKYDYTVVIEYRNGVQIWEEYFFKPKKYEREWTDEEMKARKDYLEMWGKEMSEMLKEQERARYCARNEKETATMPSYYEGDL